VRVTVRRLFVHRCPFVDEIDQGEIEISWDGSAVELHELGDYLDTWATVPISHEAVAEAVRLAVLERGGENVEVIGRFTTANFGVVVLSRAVDAS
jgi:NADPH-dependent 7-cyano-7-deazaguanine reductase QueF